MSTVRRDTLLSLQASAQAKWTALRVFEQDAPATAPDEKKKFFVSFPYPYMNGYLHIGHAFSMSKCEFAVGYFRLKGIQCLFPFGFHCTGMPIQACANKLKKEVETYGNPPVFPVDEEPSSEATAKKGAAAKTKAASKQGKAKHQWDILVESEVPQNLIPGMTDPLAWLDHFPAEGVKDLQAFGTSVDWRRSFITTDVNPYYDSFIRWQFNSLKAKDKIRYGKRLAVYSPTDGQACADHERASGEGVKPQEYTIIKMRVVPGYLDALPDTAALAKLKGRDVFLPAATLRPETMYGQTNCWVLPTGAYGAYENKGGDVFVCSERSARNMAHQEYTAAFGEVVRVGEVPGAELIGVPLEAPNAVHGVVHVLPLMTVSMTKGTGIVTSVPSDAPDDYRGLQDLKEKPALREKFGVKDEWLFPFEPVAIIDVPEYGPLSAVVACEKFGVKSQNDKEALAAAKADVYKKGFYGGKMVCGPYAGEPVEQVKTKIKDEMIAAGVAMPYSEPEKPVMSRSGDDCVVALLDQWYLTYGEEEWLEKARRCLEKMETYNDDTRKSFEHVLGWLHEWACSRSFGLGSKLPFDPQFVIESLSDSTIYMAYYTISHLLQGGVDNMNGQKVGPSGLKPENLTDAVWDYVLLGKSISDANLTASGAAREVLDMLRAEFMHWYPLDLRVSGKDLIGNHLTFFIYNHVALFEEENWPRGVRTNGFMMINAEKMSKSTGNFLTLRGGIQKYSADGIRFALADAGDTPEDANFSLKTADDAVLKLTTFVNFVEEGMSHLGEMKETKGFYEEVFESRINRAVKATEQAYEKLLFREALISGFYDMQDALGQYRVACGAATQQTIGSMNKELFLRFVRCQTIILSPLCPHTTERTWELLAESGMHGIDTSVLNSRWPEGGEINEDIIVSAKYLDDIKCNVRVKVNQLIKQKAKKGKQAEPAVSDKKEHLKIFVCKETPEWQNFVVSVLKSGFNAETKNFEENIEKKVLATIPADMKKKFAKKIMPFTGKVRDEARGGAGSAAFERTLPFDETKLLQDDLDLMTSQLGFNQITILGSDEAAEEDVAIAADALPGAPSFLIC